MPTTRYPRDLAGHGRHPPHGKAGHAAVPHTAVDALQAATLILNALYHQNTLYQQVTSRIKGITHPYLNIGLIQGGSNTNVVPGKVELKLDRRMIPEENPAEVEATSHRVIAEAVANSQGITIDIKRLLLANALKPLPGNAPLVQALCAHRPVELTPRRRAVSPTIVGMVTRRGSATLWRRFDDVPSLRQGDAGASPAAVMPRRDQHVDVTTRQSGPAALLCLVCAGAHAQTFGWSAQGQEIQCDGIEHRARTVRRRGQGRITAA